MARTGGSAVTVPRCDLRHKFISKLFSALSVYQSGGDHSVVIP
jgi:hypothetical protein